MLKITAVTESHCFSLSYISFEILITFYFEVWTKGHGDRRDITPCCTSLYNCGCGDINTAKPPTLNQMKIHT